MKRKNLVGLIIALSLLATALVLVLVISVTIQSMKRASSAEYGPVVTVTDIPVTAIPEPTEPLPPFPTIPAEEPTTEPNHSDEVSATPEPDDNVSGNIFTDNPLPDIIEMVSPSVVSVLNYISTYSYVTERNELEVQSCASGFVVTSDNYIITNAHVVDGADSVSIVTSTGDEYTAVVVGADVTTDVAVLYVADSNLPALTVGSSEAMRVGDFVLAIGSPLDSTELYGTVTFGIISATARSINIDGFTNEYLQTDAAINPGNSGGPLLNIKGEVIGMNTAKSVTAGYDEYGNAIAAEGIGFALPIDNVFTIASELITSGGITRPGIGVSIYEINDAEAQELGTVAGVYVKSVTAGGPADLGGIKAGDVIVKFNGTAVKTSDALGELIRECSVGDEVIITVYRDGEYIDLTVTIGDMNKMP